MNACSLHALYMKECAVAENAIFLEIAPSWTKNGKYASASFPYPTCFFIMG